MARFGLVGPSYVSESPWADAETLVNWYVENMESQGARSSATLYPRPGLTREYSLPESPIRAEFEVNGRVFAVAGPGVYELFADRTFNRIGSVANDGLPVSFAQSATQVVLVSAKSAYCLTLNGTAFNGLPQLSVSESYAIRTGAGTGVKNRSYGSGATTLTQSGTTVTIVITDFSGFTGSNLPNTINGPGDPVTVSGAAVTGYNGTFPIATIDYGQTSGAATDVIGAISESGATVTVEVYAHLGLPPAWTALTVGASITISGQAGYNGIYVVASKSITFDAPRSTWTLTVTYTGLAGLSPSSGGTIVYGILVYPTITYEAGVSGLADTSGALVTIYRTEVLAGAGIEFSAGEQVTLAGITDAAYDGVWTVGMLTTSTLANDTAQLHAKQALIGVADSDSGTISSSASLPSQVGYCDGFFVMMLDSFQKWRVSAPLDGLTWDNTDVSQVSTIPDDLVAMLVDHREVWFFGRTKTVVYSDSGNLFPFDVVSGGYIEQGCVAPFSPVRMDNSIFWLGQDDRGSLVAWRAQGYNPARVSTHAIEDEWQSYATVADAVSMSYQWNGHSFWQIYFPSAGKTWVYDAATQSWHREGFWIPLSEFEPDTSYSLGDVVSYSGTGLNYVSIYYPNVGTVPGTDPTRWQVTTELGRYTAHRAAYHAFAFGEHLVGDPLSGDIYKLDASASTDFGNPIRRERRAPSIGTELEFTPHKRLVIDAQLTGGDLSVRWSDDATLTWSNVHTINCDSAAGKFRPRPLFRLGRARQRIYEISTFSPLRIIDGYFNEPTERLVSNIRKQA